MLISDLFSFKNKHLVGIHNTVGMNLFICEGVVFWGKRKTCSRQALSLGVRIKICHTLVLIKKGRFS